MVFTIIFVFIEFLVKSSSGNCPHLSAPVNGVLDRNCGTKVANICRIYCRKNCQLVGDRIRHCLADNTWSGSPTYCVSKKIRCRPPLGPPDNGFIIGDCYNKVGCVCRFGCSTGYRLVGSAQVACQRNGHWTLRPTCVPISTTTTTITQMTQTCDTTLDTTTEDSTVYCPALRVPFNGALVGNCGVSPPNSVCRFACNAGYKLVGTAKRVCQRGGTWTDADVRCSKGRHQCPSLRAPTNGMLFGHCHPGLPGSKCQFSCNAGYTLVAMASLTCKSNGSWSSAPPICTSQL